MAQYISTGSTTRSQHCPSRPLTKHHPERANLRFLIMMTVGGILSGITTVAFPSGHVTEPECIQPDCAQPNYTQPNHTQPQCTETYVTCRAHHLISMIMLISVILGASKFLSRLCCQCCLSKSLAHFCDCICWSPSKCFFYAFALHFGREFAIVIIRAAWKNNFDTSCCYKKMRRSATHIQYQCTNELPHLVVSWNLPVVIHLLVLSEKRLNPGQRNSLSPITCHRK